GSVDLSFHARIRRGDRAGDTPQILSPPVLANVRGTQVERLAGDVDSNSVEVFATKDCNARDDSVPRGERFLHQRGRIDAEVEATRVDRGAQLLGRTETLNSRAASANVRLQHHRIPDSFGGGKRLRRMIDDMRFWKADRVFPNW